MRFLGGKRTLIRNIEKVINENTSGRECVFCDIFSGTGAVARYFKPRYEIYSNDLLHFSYVIQKATIENNFRPQFNQLKLKGIFDPFQYLEETDIESIDFFKDKCFITNNYSPSSKCERLFFTNQNAARIDFIRNTIEIWRTQGLLDESEYYYLLAGLIEGVPAVSNITGTYGAYLKQWDKRALKRLEMTRFEIVDNARSNKSYHEDANKLIRDLEGDILYVDPPYNERQYAMNYHLLETISQFDFPEIHGVTGMRPFEDEKSSFCIKNEVLGAFEDLIAETRFSSIIMSYSSDGLMSFSQIEQILKKYGVSDTFRVYSIPYRKYKSKLNSEEQTVCEYLFFIKKNFLQRSYIDFYRIFPRE